jgi:hypothetical protein
LDTDNRPRSGALHTDIRFLTGHEGHCIFEATAEIRQLVISRTISQMLIR